MSSFAKPQRLRQKSQFDWVFADANKFSSAQLTVLVRPNGRSRARLGLAIAKKADPHAVGRNRIKRLLREAFRAQQLLLPPVDLIVLARPTIRHASNEVVRTEFMTTLSKLSKRFNAPARGHDALTTSG
jgi:ribonuclease P protein component